MDLTESWVDCDPNFKIRQLSENKISPKYLKILSAPKNLCVFDKAINSPLVFGYIFNKADNFHKRTAIRRTWANKSLFPNLKLAFMLGLSENENVNELVKTESELYGDIVVGNYYESMRNLSFKSVMAWQWINFNCRNADYILKIDDDSVLDTFAFMKFLNTLYWTNKNLKNTYFCEILKNIMVTRDKKSKYYTTCEENPNTHYKDFCCGVINIITPDLIPKLHNASYTASYYFIDDAYVGFITNNLNISMIDILDKIVNNRKDEKLKEDFLVVRDGESIENVYEIWDIIMQKYS